MKVKSDLQVIGHTREAGELLNAEIKKALALKSATTVAGWESGKFAIDERVASYYHALGDKNDTH